MLYFYAQIRIKENQPIPEKQSHLLLQKIQSSPTKTEINLLSITNDPKIQRGKKKQSHLQDQD